MQSDGNLVLYTSCTNTPVTGSNCNTSVWATNSAGYSGEGNVTATLASNGSFVVAIGNTSLWVLNNDGIVVIPSNAYITLGQDSTQKPQIEFRQLSDNKLVVYCSSVSGSGVCKAVP